VAAPSTGTSATGTPTLTPSTLADLWTDRTPWSTVGWLTCVHGRRDLECSTGPYRGGAGWLSATVLDRSDHGEWPIDSSPSVKQVSRTQA